MCMCFDVFACDVYVWVSVHTCVRCIIKASISEAEDKRGSEHISPLSVSCGDNNNNLYVCFCSSSLPASYQGWLCGSQLNSSQLTVHSEHFPSLHSLAHPSRERDWTVTSQGAVEFRFGAGPELCRSCCLLTLSGEGATRGHSHTRWFQFKVASVLVLKWPNPCMTVLGQKTSHLAKLQTGDSPVIVGLDTSLNVLILDLFCIEMKEE